MKRLCTILIVSLLFVFMLASAALASENSPSVARASDYLMLYTVSLNAMGDDEMEVKFYVAGKRVMDEIGVTKIRIEKKVSGVWKYDRTLYEEDYADMMIEDSGDHKSSVVFTGTPGVEYRATITAYAADADGSDAKTKTSLPESCY